MKPLHVFATLSCLFLGVLSASLVPQYDAEQYALTLPKSNGPYGEIVFAAQAETRDFWSDAASLGDKAQEYAKLLVDNAGKILADASDKVHQFQDGMHALVNATGAIKRELEERGIPLDKFSGELSALLEGVSDGLKAEFPPLDTAPSHDERKDRIAFTMDHIEPAVLDAFCKVGVEDRVAKEHWDRARPVMESTLAAAADAVELHPVLVETLLVTGALMLIPEGFFLRPLLRVLGFGPLGPVKGSLASWAQRFFWGAAVKEASWFAHLQRAGMTISMGWWSGFWARITATWLWIVGSLTLRGVTGA